MDKVSFEKELERLCRVTKVVRAGPVLEVREHVRRPMPRPTGVRSASPVRKACSSLRARRMVGWLSAANGLAGTAYFFTATFADDVTDYDEALKRWVAFRKRLQREFEDVRYVAVPEVQPRSGRFHFHAVLCNLPDIKQLGQVYGFSKNKEGKWFPLWPQYFTKMWSEANGGGKVHRCDMQVARSVGGVCGYLAKYLVKDVGGTVPAGRRNYFAGGRGIARPVETEGVENVPDVWPDYGVVSRDRYGAPRSFRRYVDKSAVLPVVGVV